MGTTVFLLMADNGYRSRISTPLGTKQNTPEVMRVVRRGEESLDCNCAMSTKTPRLDRELDAIEGTKEIKVEKMVSVLEDHREERNFSILLQMTLLQNLTMQKLSGRRSRSTSTV